MKRKEDIPSMVQPADPSKFNSDPLNNVVTPQFVMMRNFSALARNWIQTGQPMLTHEYRMLYTTAGEARYVINMRPFHLTAGSALITTPGSIIEIESISDDYDMQAFVIGELPATDAFEQPTLLVLGEHMQRHILDYFDMLAEAVRTPNWSVKTVRYLILALFGELRADPATKSAEQLLERPTKGEIVFNKFLDLLNEFGDKERRIPFYAERLFLSPNRLSTIIKDFSGQTIMDWIDRRTIQRAKVLLRFTSKPIYEIGWDLGFNNPAFFAKFFRRETGMTPKEYRDNK